MVCRACPRDRIAGPPTMSARSFTIQTAPSIPGKARTIPGGPPVIQVDRPFWGRLSAGQRQALVAHEIAHHDDPRLCEHCTDMRAGARLRYEGQGAAQVVANFGAVVAGRNAGSNALEGWRLADRAIKVRAAQTSGLLTMPDLTEPRGRRIYRGLDGQSIGSPDVDGQSIGSPDVDGQSIGFPDVDGQSLGSPDVRSSSSGPRRPSQTAKAAPTPAPSTSSMLPLVVGVGIVALLILRRK